MSKDFAFEIKKHLGVIAEYSNGYKKEVNIISWNGNDPKIDIRDWDSEHAKMSRGITLHKEEAEKLLEILKEKL